MVIQLIVGKSVTCNRIFLRKCARWSILFSMAPPGVSAGAKSLGDKQRQLQQLLENQEKHRVLQQLTQIGGVQRYKAELRQALADD